MNPQGDGTKNHLLHFSLNFLLASPPLPLCVIARNEAIQITSRLREACHPYVGLRESMRSIRFVIICPFSLMRKGQRIKAKTIGPSHGLPKRLTFKSGSAFCKGKRKRPSMKVKRLVRPLGNRCPAFWPLLPAQPGQCLAFPHTENSSLNSFLASLPLPLCVIARNEAIQTSSRLRRLEIDLCRKTPKTSYHLCLRKRRRTCLCGSQDRNAKEKRLQEYGHPVS